MNMGEVRPLIVKEMKPHSEVGIKKDNIIMTAPLNVYTYGKIDYETISHFVPEEKIFPRIGSFLSGEATACPNDPNGWESVPETKPSTIAGILASYMLIGSKLNVWRSLDHFRSCNDADEKNGCQSFERVCLEELLEIIQAAQNGDDKERIHETLQLIGVLVRSIQENMNEV